MLSNATNASIYKNIGIGTIYDSSGHADAPYVHVSDIVADETTGTATFVVTLDQASNSVVSLDYATQNGTALAGSDYTAQSGTLNFGVGETVKVVTVALTNDTVAEGDETFSLVLSNLVNANSLHPSASAVIAANDASPAASPKISVGDVIVDEKVDYADFVVRLSAPSTQEVSVSYATKDGVAYAGTYSDFIAASGVLKFAPGETVKTVHVKINDDGNIEPTEDFQLVLSNAVGVSIDNGTATATLYDSESTHASNPTTLDASAGEVTLYGLDRNDTITGNSLDNAIFAGGGDDTVKAGLGNDYLDGGVGDDKLDGGEGTDTVAYSAAAGSVAVNLNTKVQTGTGADGNDTLANIENVVGSGFADKITGSKVANVISGGAGNDLIDGGLGNDLLDGGLGTDTIIFTYIKTGVTVDLALTTAQNTVGAGTDTITGFENATGSRFGDTLNGSDARNVLRGGLGDDTLDGKLGADTLFGGAGHDTFQFSTAPASKNTDTIRDFVVGEDRIALSQGIYGVLSAGTLADSQFTEGTSAQTSDQHVIYNSANGYLYYDADGQGGHSQTLIAKLATGLALSAHDVVVI